MTRPELHALVDIVIDAREKHNREIKLEIFDNIHFWDHSSVDLVWIDSWDYPTFSDFTQAVKEYIKTLENEMVYRTAHSGD